MREQRRRANGSEPASHQWGGYAAAALGVAAMTGLIYLIPGASHIANISMLYLSVVIGLALRFGSSPAIFAAILAFLAFDWFFVQPFYTFTVRDPAEWLALVMFLITASIVGQLTALLRQQADEARRRERETAVLAEASWAVASQIDRERALSAVLRRIAEVAPVRAAAILAVGNDGTPEVVAEWYGDRDAHAESDAESTHRAVRFVLAEGRSIGWAEDRHHWEKALQNEVPPGAAYLPLITEHRVQGLLYLQLPEAVAVSPPERRVIESLAHLAAVVLERDRLARAESRANALAEADRLKTALLSMVSHDFRSPLASIKAIATACLQGEAPADPAAQRDLHGGIIQEVDRLNGLVGNILALSRLEADAWRPQREDAALEEVVEAARSGLSRDENSRVEVCLDSTLEEVWLDPVQIGQVLHNLLDNALKYSPAQSKVKLQVLAEGTRLIFEVLDRGPGLPPGEEERVFERFYRAPALRESAVPGVGVGLSVCRGLVEAHGGTLTGHNREGGGALFRVTLPLGRET